VGSSKASKAPSRKVLEEVYRRLLERFGRRGWWPARTPFEVAVGAVLTQNTAWSNVEKAIQNLKRQKLLSPRSLLQAPLALIGRSIRPAGYFRLKAKRLKPLVKWWVFYGSPVRGTRNRSLVDLRQELLNLHGVGPETADSILLYALKRPSFVVDTYTRRMLTRHGWTDESATYSEVQSLFVSRLPRRVALYNEFHALIVELGKELCLKGHPKCQECPLRGLGRLQLKGL